MLFRSCMSLCQPVIWSMAAMLRDSVVVVVRTRPRAIPLAMITMRKTTHGFPFVSHMWDAYGAPLGGPLGRRSSAINSLHLHHRSSGLTFLPRNARLTNCLSLRRLEKCVVKILKDTQAKYGQAEPSLAIF